MGSARRLTPWERDAELFPPREGWLVSESYLQHWQRYPPEVQQEKEELCRRLGALPAAGPLPSWGPEQLSLKEKAMLRMTEAGRRDFEAKVARLTAAGVPEKRAVAYVAGGGRADERSIRIAQARALTLEEMRDSPYYADRELREWGRGRAGAQPADLRSAAELFAEERLGLSTDPADRKEALRRIAAAAAPPPSPLGFSPWGLRRPGRALEPPAPPEPPRRRQQQQQQQQEEPAHPAAERQAAAATQGGAAVGPAAGSPEEAVPMPTPEDFRRHVEDRERELARRREALREKNLAALRNPRPISETIRGGDYASAAMLDKYRRDSLRARPGLMQELWPDSYWDTARSAEGAAAAPGPGRPEESAEEQALRAAVGAWKEAALQAAREMAGDAGRMGSLSAALAAGGGLRPEYPEVHPWHAHCCRLLAKAVVDEHLLEQLEAPRHAREVAQRSAILRHDLQKLDKLTVSLGPPAYELFWQAAQHAGEELSEGPPFAPQGGGLLGEGGAAAAQQQR